MSFVSAPRPETSTRRQLAGWLAERAGTEEAIEVIRPVADAGDDIAQLWLARWLAERDYLDELRHRAGAGGVLIKSSRPTGSFDLVID